MKLGVAGLFPSDWQQIDLAAAQQVRAAGFKGASVFIKRPLEADPMAILRLKQCLDQAGLEVAQANGWYECLVNPDDSLRAEGVKGLQALCRLGAQLQAKSIYARPGSLNPRGAWTPHPDNHQPKTFERLGDSLRQVCAVAQSEGVMLAVEGHVVSPLDSPQRVRELLDAVASPALKFNLDPVNFIGTVRDAHDPACVINQLFDLLGAETVAAHAKDCALAEALVVHLNEVPLGTGTVNYELFLSRFAECCPDGYLLIEHLPDEQIPAARAVIEQIAGRLDLLIEG